MGGAIKGAISLSCGLSTASFGWTKTFHPSVRWKAICPPGYLPIKKAVKPVAVAFNLPTAG